MNFTFLKWMFIVIQFSLISPLNCSKTFLKRRNLYSTEKSYIRKPVLFERPFVSVWNIESGQCKSQYGIDIDLKDFDIVYNKNETRDGKKMMIFYASLLGNYPYLNNDGDPVNGGLPQLGNLTSHLEKCKKDIEHFLPDPSFSGLSVIDWESWVPNWKNMGWGTRQKYQEASIDKVKLEHPDWSKNQLINQATLEYETAAKRYIVETLKLCKKLRPSGYWGFYLFPDCQNYDKTGRDLSCPSRQIIRDDEIQWMFDESTALYPSTYLGIWFKNQDSARAYTGNRVKEASRVDYNRYGNISIPIYVYNNLVYRKTRTFLTLKDVIDSSGVAAALGTSGVVLWGDHMHENKSWCIELSKYVNNTLGPFLKLASDAASECSISMCNGNGRCKLEMNSAFQEPVVNIPFLMDKFLKLVFQGRGSYLDGFSLQCQCYQGWHGNRCEYNK